MLPTTGVGAGVDDVIALLAVDDIVAARVGDDVVAGAAEELVVAVATFQAVVAGIAVSVSSPSLDMRISLAAVPPSTTCSCARVLEVVGVGADRGGVIPNHQGDEGVVAQRVFPRGGNVVGALSTGVAGLSKRMPSGPGLLATLALNCCAGPPPGSGPGWRTRARAGASRSCSAMIRLEKVLFSSSLRKFWPWSAVQVVEAGRRSARTLELRLEHEVEGGAQHAAEGHLLLGEAADPEVHGVEPGDGDSVGAARPGARAVQEVEAVGGRTSAAEHDRQWPRRAWPPASWRR